MKVETSCLFHRSPLLASHFMFTPRIFFPPSRSRYPKHKTVLSLTIFLPFFRPSFHVHFSHSYCPSLSSTLLPLPALFSSHLIMIMGSSARVPCLPLLDVHIGLALHGGCLECLEFLKQISLVLRYSDQYMNFTFFTLLYFML